MLSALKVICPDCESQMAREHLSAHQSKACPKRKETCEFCHVQHAVDQLVGHRAECKKSNPPKEKGGEPSVDAKKPQQIVVAKAMMVDHDNNFNQSDATHVRLTSEDTTQFIVTMAEAKRSGMITMALEYSNEPVVVLHEMVIIDFTFSLGRKELRLIVQYMRREEARDMNIFWEEMKDWQQLLLAASYMFMPNLERDCVEVLKTMGM